MTPDDLNPVRWWTTGMYTLPTIDYFTIRAIWTELVAVVLRIRHRLLYSVQALPTFSRFEVAHQHVC
ncbi:MAG: hypothetical protein ACREVK_02595 [Gammaproteobacteria bacterium]